MNRQTGLIITILVLLTLGLAYNTVTQSLNRSDHPPATAAPPTAISPPAAPAADAAGCSTEPAAFPPVNVTPGVPKTKLVGDWLNEKKDARALTRITIAEKPDGLAVTPWALHRTGEKPYGEAKPAAMGKGNPITVTWEAGFADNHVRIALLDDGRLRVDTATVVLDANGTKGTPAVEYFTKATPESLQAHKQATQAAAAKLAKAETATKPPAGGT